MEEPVRKSAVTEAEEREMEKRTERLALYARMLVLVLTVPVLGIQLSMLRNTEEVVDADIGQQIETLNEMEESAQDLVNFVASQRERLREAEEVVNELRAEQQTLEPVVTANRETVDAIFAAQQSRNSSQMRTERWIGFLFGIIASLVASLLFAGGQALWKRRNRNTQSAKPAV